MIRLLRPPFSATHRDPGYIKAYPAGVRENGGQYSHAAAWVGHALAEIGDGDGAYRIFDILNPIRRTETRADAEHYRAEPYVLAADIASEAPHAGKAGWTWYTGAAAWTWRLGVECILGIHLENGDVRINPCLPKGWGGAEATINGPGGALAITIEDTERLGHGDVEVTVDGKQFPDEPVPFPSDGSTRHVRVRIVPKPKGGAHPRVSTKGAAED